ncbi:MADS-box transcription factor 30 isoform X1 [Triticum aestivum]|uniref:MADS-box transcription factor 29 n=1 Tax=Aegilops tauschii TaxID=37682 RepID=R7W4V2_AEGTA|nr:MADS-box transcription factor 30-like isoform X1 [Triticum aestivum]
MGRGRTEMKKIQNDVSRRATFGKRRRGLLKKAHELAVLCGVDLGLLVFDDDGAGKLFDYCAPNTSWSELIERYESITKHQFQFQGQGIHHDDHQQQPSADIIAGLRREGDHLEASVTRQTGENLSSTATAAELDELEQRLECVLGKVRETKDKLLEQQLGESHHKVHILEDQNSFLRRLVIVNDIAACLLSCYVYWLPECVFTLCQMGEEGQQRAAVEASAVPPKLPEVEEEELTTLRLWPRQLPDV